MSDIHKGPPVQQVHRWSGWPGAYCLNCGTEDPMESAISCPDCYIPVCEEDQTERPDWKLCPEHQRWFNTHKTCPPSEPANAIT